MTTNDIKFARSFQFLFRPARYKVGYGGRGSAKSWSFARALILSSASRKERILCGREIQNSIKESVHKLLSDQIEAMGLGDRFSILESEIRGKNGSEFIFAGLRSNPHKIKSTEGVDKAWIEEAEKVSERSWELLIPTIRKPGSEIWVSFNPDEETDPAYQRFVLNPPPDAIVQKINWRDNPWFPEELRKEMEYLYRVDPESAAHVWGGECRKVSNAQIFKGKYVIEAFEPNPFDQTWSGPYLGSDWGFADDPTAAIKVWIRNRKLYIEYESWELHLGNDEIANRWRKDIPGIDSYKIRADSSRPETIHHVSTKGGLKVVGAPKWPGSVEDGIQYLRSFEQIVIHPRCKRMEEEARLYRYKADPITGDILPSIVDKHNHLWDAVRYALQPAIRNGQEILPDVPLNAMHPDEAESIMLASRSEQDPYRVLRN
jgi:phage terminase large subunit